MPLGPPPSPARLSGLPSRAVPAVLYRVYRRVRSSPWRFASIDAGTPRGGGGRFDLPTPDGACSTATSVAAATLEAFQEHARGLLPDSELRGRQLATIRCSGTAPRAARLTAARAASVGVTQALWADNDRTLTQRWAVALRRAGWLALFTGIQHDPTGRGRAVTLFDSTGEHLPYDDPGWTAEVVELADHTGVHATLARHGFEVVSSDPKLEVIDLDTYLSDSPARRPRR